MAHNFKVGDRVRLRDLARGFAERWGLTGTLVFAGINHAGHAREREGWINIDRNLSGTIFPRSEFWKDKRIADQFATPNRIACLHVKFREGDSL